MGFGLLLIGYMFAFVATVGLGPYMFAGMLIGGFFMYLGLSELKKYSPVFIYALIVSIAIVFCSFFKTAIWIDSFLGFGWGLDSELISNIFSWSKFGLYILFDFTVLYGIADLSRRVEYPETRSKAFRNMIIVGVFNIFQIIMMLPIKGALPEQDLNFLMTLLAICQVVYSAINCFLIFKCYAMICPEGQEDMPRKKSKFEFVNKIREKKDAKEEKAIEDMKNYYEEKLRARNAKRQSKNKKK
jgi:hypothetical protein